ncbi:MAG: hypothetical protein ABIS17_06830 [Casimicrobiaceae bacterium]
MSSHHSAQAFLQEQLARTARLHAARRADPTRAASLHRLARWQAVRLRQTYPDLAVEPRYAAAIRFFENDLYGGGDFGNHDSDLARATSVMSRMLPEKVILTVAEAVELNVLSHELDAALLDRLPDPGAPFDVASYCGAYRAMARRDERERQIGLIGAVGAALDAHVRKPLVRTALAMMRRPAHLAGFGALHDFLERGFRAFRDMHGAHAFLAIVTSREASLMDRIFAGDAAPFADPMGVRPA